MQPDTSILDEALGRTKDEQPKAEKPTYKGHTAVPDEAIYAIPNHLKRELGCTDDVIGKEIKRCFGTDVTSYIGTHGVKAAWDCALEFEHLIKLQRGTNEEETPMTDQPTTTVPDAPQSSNRALAEDQQQNGVGPIRNGKAGPVGDTQASAVQQPVPIKAALSSAWTEVRINGHSIVVTAYQGQTGQQVADNVFALLEGLRIIAKDERVKEYAPVIDGRDQARPIKTDGEFVTAPPPQTAPPVSADSGSAVCMLVKVGKTYKGDKDQLSFDCEGFEEPLKYSAKDSAAFLKIIAGLRKADGTPIQIADLVQGNKFAVRGKVLWKKSDDGKYNNVMGTEAA